MTHRERVIAALEGRPVDRLPHFEPFLEGFVQRWRAESGAPANLWIGDWYGVDIDIAAAEEGAFASRAEVLESGDGWRVRRDVWGRVLREQPGKPFYEVLEQVVDRRDAFAEMVFDDPLAAWRYEGYDRQVQRFERRGSATFCKIGGPFLRTTFVRGEEEYLADIAGDPAFARLLADKMADHLLAVAVESLRRGGAFIREVGVSMWDDIAYNTGPFFSPRSFERIFLPGYARLVAACKEAGARWFFFHSDGDIRPLLPALAEIGVDLINPVEPRAGLDVVALSEQYRGRLAFIGGVDNSGVICRGTPAEVRAHTAPIARAARERGGIIIGMHSVESDVPVANYEAYHAAVSAA